MVWSKWIGTNYFISVNQNHSRNADDCLCALWWQFIIKCAKKSYHITTNISKRCNLGQILHQAFRSFNIKTWSNPPFGWNIIMIYSLLFSLHNIFDSKHISSPLINNKLLLHEEMLFYICAWHINTYRATTS